MGSQRHFPRNTLYLFKHTMPYPLPAQVEMKARQQKNLNNELRARWQLVGPWYFGKMVCQIQIQRRSCSLLSLTVLAHMILWTKRTWGWEMAEADCRALRTWYTGNVRQKCKLFPTKVTNNSFPSEFYVLKSAAVHPTLCYFSPFIFGSEFCHISLIL